MLIGLYQQLVYLLLAKVEHLVVGQDYGSVHYLVGQRLGIVLGGQEIEVVGVADFYDNILLCNRWIILLLELFQR